MPDAPKEIMGFPFVESDSKGEFEIEIGFGPPLVGPRYVDARLAEIAHKLEGLHESRQVVEMEDGRKADVTACYAVGPDGTAAYKVISAIVYEDGVPISAALWSGDA